MDADKGYVFCAIHPKIKYGPCFLGKPSQPSAKTEKLQGGNQARCVVAHTLELGATLNEGPWEEERRYLELAPGFALCSTDENPNRPQGGQPLLVETHANVFVIRPSTPIIHIFSSFLCCRFSLVARSQIKHTVS